MKGVKICHIFFVLSGKYDENMEGDNRPLWIHENSHLAPRLERIKRKKTPWSSGISNGVLFVLFSPNFATNDWFPCEMTYERRRQKFHTNDPSLPRSDSTWLVESNFPNDTFRSATQIWLVMRHQYSISALVSQTSFRGEGYYSASPNWAPGSRSLLLCMCCTTLIFTSTSLQKTPRTHSDT